MSDKVKLRVASARGHDIIELAPQDAVEEITRRVNDGTKWAYIDGEVVRNTSDVTVERVAQAENITLANQVVGG